MSWMDFLQPASFNGVPFYVETTERASGRRIAVHEYPGRDDPYVEDLGRLPRNFSLKCYLTGAGFIAKRLLLETALENSNQVATLIHPTYGILNVWVGAIKSTETRTGGSYASIEVNFTLDGGAASPLAITDTVSTLLAGLNSLVPFLQAAYIAGVAASIASNFIAILVGNQLTSAGNLFSSLPQATQAGITPGFAANVASPSATAAAVTSAFQAAAANMVAAQPVAPASTDPVAGATPALLAPADPSGGLLALASFSLPAQAPAALPAMVTAQAAVVTLITGAALLATLSVYAQTNWQSSNQAMAARQALQPLLDAQIETAADSGNYDLFRAWRAIAAQANADLTERAQNLPSLATYSVKGQIPALALANLLYQDATQADVLVALNQAPHPLFMAASGQYLQAA